MLFNFLRKQRRQVLKIYIHTELKSLHSGCKIPKKVQTTNWGNCTDCVNRPFLIFFQGVVKNIFLNNVDFRLLVNISKY